MWEGDGLRGLHIKARVVGSVHPSQVIVRGIDRRRIWRMAELPAICARQRSEIIIEGVVFFYNDNDVFDWHSHLPPRRGLLPGQSRTINYTP
jgi:hypothetical protein